MNVFFEDPPFWSKISEEAKVGRLFEICFMNL